MVLSSTNVKFSDVKTALGETTNSLKSLCTSNKINKWSLWKPIQRNNPITNVNDIYASDCGFDLFFVQNGSINSNIMGQNFDCWTYNIPSSNYRLGDFRNYDSDKKPWYDFEVSLITNNNKNYLKFKFDIPFPNFTTEIQSLINYTYIGIVVYGSLGTKTYITNIETFNDMSEVLIPSPSFPNSHPAEQWSVRLVLFENISQQGTWVDNLSEITYTLLPLSYVRGIKNETNITKEIKISGTLYYSRSGSIIDIGGLYLTLNSNFSDNINLEFEWYGFENGPNNKQETLSITNGNTILNINDFNGSYECKDSPGLVIKITYAGIIKSLNLSLVIGEDLTFNNTFTF